MKVEKIEKFIFLFAGIFDIPDQFVSDKLDWDRGDGNIVLNHDKYEINELGDILYVILSLAQYYLYDLKKDHELFISGRSAPLMTFESYIRMHKGYNILADTYLAMNEEF